MLRLDAQNLVAAAANLHRMAHDFATMSKDQTLGHITPLIPQMLHILKLSIKEIMKVASDLNLDATLSAARNSESMLDLFSEHGSKTIFIRSDKILNVAMSLHALNTSLESQLSSRIFYAINSNHAAHLANSDAIFGEAVATAFPEAQDDIAEAGKCLALERYSATVFHLMRAMEVALREIAAKLGATVQNSEGRFLTWGVMAANIKQKINAMPEGSAKDSWFGLHSHFDSVNRAWRNKTMHPQQSYTSDQAASALSSTKVFMENLAPLI